MDRNLYIKSSFPVRLPEKLEAVRKKAMDMGIPIIPEDTVSLLQTVFALLKPEKVLEIGCAVGFSAGLFASLVPDGGSVVTIDRYPYMIEKAKENFNLMDISHKVKLLEGDAAAILPTLDEFYDFIFLDAAKGQYPFFLPQCLRLLKKGGVLCADDIFLSGMLYKDPLQIPRRHRTAQKRMKEFLNVIFNDSSLQSAILNVGGGLSLAVKL